MYAPVGVSWGVLSLGALCGASVSTPLAAHAGTKSPWGGRGYRGRGGACALCRTPRMSLSPPWTYRRTRTQDSTSPPVSQCVVRDRECRTSSVSSGLKIWCRSRLRRGPTLHNHRLHNFHVNRCFEPSPAGAGHLTPCVNLCVSLDSIFWNLVSKNRIPCILGLQ